MVDRTATRAGRKFQRDLTRYLRTNGLDAEDLTLAGAEDEGDVALRDHGSVFILEAKRTKGFTPADWVRQAELEARNWGKHRGRPTPYWAVVAARRNHGVGKAYVVTTLDQWLIHIDSALWGSVDAEDRVKDAQEPMEDIRAGDPHAGDEQNGSNEMHTHNGRSI